MSNPTPTDELVEELIDAMVCVMNDMGEDGKCVCAYVKAKARVAIDPFLRGDYGDMPDLEWAKKVLADCDKPEASGGCLS